MRRRAMPPPNFVASYSTGGKKEKKSAIKKRI
jgi:hypothetical protein